MTSRKKSEIIGIIRSDKSIIIAIIITVSVNAVVVLSYLVYASLRHMILTDDDVKNMLVAIISITSSGAITCIVLFYQDKFEIKRDQMLDEINKISDDQYRRSISLVQGSMISVSQTLDKIKKVLNESKSQSKISKNDLENLTHEANENQQLLGDIHYEILHVVDLFKQTASASAKSEVKIDENFQDIDIEDIKRNTHCETIIKNEIYLLQKHIDSLLFNEIIDENFQDIDIEDIIRNTHCDILIGYKSGYDDDDDYKQADRLKKVLDQRFKSTIIRDNIITDEKNLKNNLIVLGGPRANRLTNKFSKSFVSPHLHIKNPSNNYISDAFYSRVNRKIYRGPDYATIQAIKSPFKSNKIIIFAFGANQDGTRITIDFLIRVFHKKENDLYLKYTPGNKNKNIYPAKIIKRIDTDSTYLIEE
jgi:hypothetical protein